MQCHTRTDLYGRCGMDEADLCDSELDFSEGLMIEVLGEDTIVCFPNIMV